MPRAKKSDIGYGYNSEFPTLLRALMVHTTQDELADYIGITRQSIAQYKDGKTKPDIHYLGRIADYFNVSTDYLLGREEIKSTSVQYVKKIELENLAISKKLETVLQVLNTDI